MKMTMTMEMLMLCEIPEGSVEHDEEVTEVMTEMSEDYWPGVKMIVYEEQ